MLPSIVKVVSMISAPFASFERLLERRCGFAPNWRGIVASGERTVPTRSGAQQPIRRAAFAGMSREVLALRRHGHRICLAARPIGCSAFVDRKSARHDGRDEIVASQTTPARSIRPIFHRSHGRHGYARSATRRAGDWRSTDSNPHASPLEAKASRNCRTRSAGRKCRPP